MSNVSRLLEEQILNEVGASTVRISKTQKRSRLAGREAIRIAKAKGDPMYFKYRKFRNAALELKRRLMMKYGRKGMQMARQEMK